MQRPTFPIAITTLIAALVLPGAARGQAGGAVLNKAGVPVKLITTRTTQLHSQPDPSSASSPCPVFKFWYVLPPDRTAPSRQQEDLGSLTRNGYYRVASGDSEGEFRGWVAEADAVEWHHRQAAKFSPRHGRGLAHFFGQSDEAKAAAESGDVGAATHREPESSGGELILMPVLDVSDVAVDGQEMQLYEMAFMAGHPETAPAPSAAGVRVEGLEGPVTQERVREETTVDIVFVVDTTHSMQPVIDKVRRSIESVANELAADEQLRPRLRFGLVGYRDTIPQMHQMEYLARVFCHLEGGQDHRLFLQRLGQLEEAPVGSGGYPEDGLAGIDLAMDFETLKWNPLGWKHVVVVGDASWKESEHPDGGSRRSENNRTIAGLLAKAQPGNNLEALTQAGFVFTPVRVKDPRAAQDHLFADRQANRLAAGRTHSGEAIHVRGGVGAEDFSAKLTEEILGRLRELGDLASGNTAPGGTPAPSPGPTRPSAPTNTSSADFPWPVLEILQAVGSGNGGGTGGMQFENRYSTEYDADGNRVFVPHLFIRKGQLLSFTSMLDFLQGQLEDAGEPGSRDVTAIVKGLQTLSLTLNIAEPISADMPVETFLSMLLGFPIKNPIFQLTIADLAAMSQTDYDDWVKSVKAQKEALQALTENAHIWKKLHQDAKDRDAHAFVPMSDLP